MRKGRLKGNMENTNRPPLKGAPSDICTTPYKPSPFNSKILISGIVIDGTHRGAHVFFNLNSPARHEAHHRKFLLARLPPSGTNRT